MLSVGSEFSVHSVSSLKSLACALQVVYLTSLLEMSLVDMNRRWVWGCVCVCTSCACTGVPSEPRAFMGGLKDILPERQGVVEDVGCIHLQLVCI